MVRPTVPDGCVLREASVEDATAVADLVNEVNVAEVGVPWLSLEEVRDLLTLPTREPSDHTLLFAADGSLVGYLMVSADRDPFTTAEVVASVPPSLWGRGLNAWLLGLGEELVRERVEATGDVAAVALRVARWTTNAAAVPLFESLGYRPVRTFDNLRVDFDGPPDPPAAPPGIDIRAFDRDVDAERVYATLREAFDDHWGRTFEPYEDWAHEELESAVFDPGLWFVALEGDEVVGALAARDQSIGTKPVVYVGTIGVRRPWRSRGIARALLLSVFAETHRRGYPAVELGVDAENPTGATRLYERVGMRVVRSIEVWEKEVRRAPPAAAGG